MADLETDITALMDQLLTDEISRRETFYVAEITGEDDQYGLAREFVTDKNSPYSLTTSDLSEGGVYEVKDESEGLRAYFKTDALGVDADGTTPINLTLIGDDSTADDDVLAALEGDNAKRIQQRNRLEELADDADVETLEAVADALEAADGGESTVAGALGMADTDADDAGELTIVDLSEVPGHVYDEANLAADSFEAAYEKHTDESPGPLLRAVALDAAVLKLKQQKA